MIKRIYLLNANRAVIYVLSLIGFFYEVNIAYIIALTLWLWLPLCLQLELLLLKIIKKKSSFVKVANAIPTIKTQS